MNPGPNDIVEVYTIDPLEDSRWAELVEKHPRASVFHTPEWLQTIRRTYGYKPVVFTTSAPTGQLENGLLFCEIQSWLTGRRIVSLPFSDHCEPLFDAAEELDCFVNHLRANLEQQRLRYVEVRPRTSSFNFKIEAQGFGPTNRYFLHRLDIRPDLADIFRGLHKDSVQRRIRHAERCRLVCQCGRSKNLLKDFYALQLLTRKRHHLPPQPYEWFENMLDRMGKAFEIRSAYEGTSPVAAIVNLRFRNTTYYKYGCSDLRFKDLGAMPLLLWKTIQDSKATGAETLDLGRSDVDNDGLIAFKDHWAPGPAQITYWRYPSSAYSVTKEKWKLGAARRLFACLPSSLLAATGRLLYRHVG